MAEKDKKKNKRPSAKKRDIQSVKRQQRNGMLKSRISTAVKNFEKSSEDGKTKALNLVYSLLDKATKNGVIKLNKAGRLKSKFAHRS